MTPDMIAARQELDLRPQLERLDRLIFGSEGIDEGALGFAFRPLWQLDEPAKAALASSKAQATQIYAGLGLWPAEVTAKLVEAQLVQDRTYPNATAVFAGAEATEDASGTQTVLDVDPAEPRDLRGRWVRAGGGAGMTTGVARAPDRRQAEASPPPVSLSALLSLPNPIGTAQAAGFEEERDKPRAEVPSDPTQELRNERYGRAVDELRSIDPTNPAFYNPERGLSFTDKEVDATIEQAMNYALGDPPRKLIYYTNDWALAEYYTRAFRGVGLSNFRFIIVPATRKPR